MTLKGMLLLYVFSAIVFFAVDMLWLGVVARNMYRKYLGYIMRSTVNWPAAVIFYLLFIAGILIFAVLPAIKNSSVSYALIYGLLFGFFTYMTYELTNYAVIKDWPFSIVLIDIVWGMVLSGIVSVSGYYIYGLFPWSG